MVCEIEHRFGEGEWSNKSRDGYNLYDPVVRSTVQVYPGRWTAVYAFLDNPGMWNLRSQNLVHWYMGQEIYIRVHDDDPNPAKERPPPDNLLLCGQYINTHKHVCYSYVYTYLYAFIDENRHVF